MLHSGQGATSVNAFLTTLNLPSYHHKSLKRRERESGPEIESLAKRLCEESLKREKELASASLGTDNASTVDLTVSYDAAWNKRGSGRSYNSKSGENDVNFVTYNICTLLPFLFCSKTCLFIFIPSIFTGDIETQERSVSLLLL